MVQEHLLDEGEFWGRYVIPSIARNDPGYAGNDYWRGRIWGPMNFLVAEGLRRYRFDEAAHAFARRGLDLLLGEWRSEGHVHENYNAETGDGDDVPNSDPMYTWGALLGYVAMQELVDCEPWAGWRFGNLSSDPASLEGIHLAGDGGGRLDAAQDAQGLRVTLDGRILLSADGPALITGWRRETSRLAFHVQAPSHRAGELRLTVGRLPAGADVAVTAGGHAERRRTDEDGQLRLALTAPCQVEIRW